MTFDPDLATIRFGTGLSPLLDRPQRVDDLMSELVGPDDMATEFPIPGFDDTSPSFAAMSFINRAERDARGTASADAARAARQVMRDQIRPTRERNRLQIFARAVAAPFGLKERLVAFWSDHFTVTSRRLDTRHLVSSFAAEAIRPHINGSFRDMLRAVVTHPMMLLYLEQSRSVGPGSKLGQQRGLGLNENLARELLELHLLGVGSSYTQTDVTELAELLTGLTVNPNRGVIFNPNRAEPGAERVLGRTYGPDATRETVLGALDDLAVLPQTAQHLAHKMAVHFITPTPEADLVAAMANAFGPNGDLLAMTEAMLAHPSAWANQKSKVRQPYDFVIAALRALGLSGTDITGFDTPTYRRVLRRPLRVMGQPTHEAPGPDGWPEAAVEWIIPQAMAARITWAMTIPNILIGELPDPRDFAVTALGSTLPSEVRFAASAAEKRRDGVGVVLASAAFQRR